MSAAAGARTKLRLRTLLLGILALCIAIVLAIIVGAGDLGPGRVATEIWAQLTGGTSPLSTREAAVVWQLRVPRVLLAGLVGAALASSGACFQGVFRNPLADPYLLGAAAGAGMAATIVMVIAPVTTDSLIGPVPLAAFGGALGGVGLSWVIGRSTGGNSTATLLLAGVAVSSFLGAGQTFAQQLNTDQIKQVYTWMMGGLTLTSWRELLVVLPYITVAATLLCLCARLLDVLALGDAEAESLGLRPGRIRLLLLAGASLATAAAVSVSGLIGFVGIVVPHLVRMLIGVSYRVVVPLSLIGGAIFLIVADHIARTIMPSELPLGVVTAFTGAPFFAFVLRSSRERM